MLGALHYILSTAEVDADTKELEHRALVKIRLHTRALLAKIEGKVTQESREERTPQA